MTDIIRKKINSNKNGIFQVNELLTMQCCKRERNKEDPTQKGEQDVHV
jgi:hypothetical protein